MKKYKAVVFGVGESYKDTCGYIHEVFDVIAVVDNDCNKQGTIINDFEIMPPEIIKKLDYDYILITPFYEKSIQIKNQLIQMGVSESKFRYYNGGGLEPYKIDPRFFSTDLCSSQKEMLFSQNIERVILELNSKCNRKCWFCTNSVICNNTENIDMSDQVFETVIEQLVRINYSQEICLSFFNEPMLCSRIYERIQYIKNKLPDCFVYMFSNGDMIDSESLPMLEQSGLDMLIIDIYQKTTDYDFEQIKQSAHHMLNRLGLNMNLHEYSGKLKGFVQYGNMDIEILSQNFAMIASNRAESLPEGLPVPKIDSHPLPCIKNFMSFHIDFRGDVWPCPNYHRDFESHRQYCLGNVLDESVFEIYTGEKMNTYREKNFFHRNELPCRSCIWNFNSFISNRYHRPFRNRPSAIK
ncbi:MAG: SPASM domain-containing protein [Oscillospiraceae bacterium]